MFSGGHKDMPFVLALKTHTIKRLFWLSVFNTACVLYVQSMDSKYAKCASFMPNEKDEEAQYVNARSGMHHTHSDSSRINFTFYERCIFILGTVCCFGLVGCETCFGSCLNHTPASQTVQTHS